VIAGYFFNRLDIITSIRKIRTKNNVWNEEDAQSNVVLSSCEM
jgi:hypothetical protein